MTLSPLGSGWHPLLVEAATTFARQSGLPAISESELLRVAPLLDRVAVWTPRVDLTAAKDARAVVELYLTDALPLAALIAKDATVVDVGSGGGAPGLTLALLRPDLQVHLIEPRAKRVAFLRSSASELRCQGVSVKRARSEELDDVAFDVAMSRATFAPEEWVRQGARLATLGIWCFLAKAEVDAPAGWRAGNDVTYELPFSGAPRRALEFVRRGTAGA